MVGDEISTVLIVVVVVALSNGLVIAITLP
jgi:hypothetical protein